MKSDFFEVQSDSKLLIKGDWTLQNISELLAAKRKLLSKNKESDLEPDFEQLESMDTNGAYVLLQIVGKDKLDNVLENEGSQLPSQYQKLLETVNDAYDPEALDKSKERKPWYQFLQSLGKSSIEFWDGMLMWINFFGMAVASISYLALQPHRWRVTSVFANIDSTGIRAVPIVSLLNFMVGAVVAFLGATVLENFGAQNYTIQLVAFSFLREFGVLLTAILIAGRTASAYAAQIGSMKINEEIDALKSSGVNPIEMLVLPRICGLLVSLPILTIISMIAGLAGGLAVCTFMLGISPTMFLEGVHDVPLKHFIVGLAKAPIFAIMIAITGCVEGFKVGGSAQSVGEHTTSSVVQSIFIVITIDAIAAIFCMEMGW